MNKISLLFIPCLLLGNPSGGQVVTGSAEISHAGAQCTIHASDKAVIHWDHFGVGARESTVFVQPSAASAVLNRVIGKNISEIHGLLQANGKLFLINPNGILIGPEGVVQAGGFLASTLDLLGSVFDPESALQFQGEGGSLVNLGTIRGQEWVALVAPHVSNSGVIETAALGVGSSHSVLVRPRSHENVWIELPDTASPYPYAQAINMEGTVRACHLAEEGGEIVLKADKGTIALRGELIAPGGFIEVSGSEVLITSEALISASGLENGDSGDVVICADDFLSFEGKIEAKGGSLGGDGGFVEVSGKSMLFKGTVDRTAPQGQAGLLLIDPSDILITTVTSANVMFAANTYSVNAALPTPATIDAAAINASLAGGPVTVTTSSAFGDVGNITITSPISWASGFPLALLADGSITVSGTVIQDLAAGQMTLFAQNSITLDAASISSAGGDISLSAVSGDVLLQGTALASATIASFGGDIQVSAGRDITLLNAGNPLTTEVIIGVLPGGGSTAITAGRDVVLFNQAFATTPNPAAIGGSDTLTITAGRDVLFQNPTTFIAANTGNLDVTAGRNVSIDSLSGIFVVNVNSVITIVTDNQAPAAPQVGDGGLQMGPQAIIGIAPIGPTPPVDIRIYTAIPSQNTITNLNWGAFVHDPSGTNSATEVYGIYFPSAIPTTSPLRYIVFYKTVDVPVAVLTQQTPQVISSGFEALRKFAYRQPYSLLNEVEQFWTLYQAGELNRTFYPIYMTNYREFTP